jgi:streptomycin 6-kinase
VRIPDALNWLRASVEGGAWLDTLPRLVQACTAVWDLRVGEPYATSSVSLALPATRADGSPAVLKIQLPDRESEHEADALARWGGEGAVRLLEWDPELHALLLERCDPGTPLSGEEPERALDVLIGLLPRLWVPAGAPFRPLAEEAAWWADGLVERWERAGRPFERRLVDAALDMLLVLPDSQGEQVLLHQDLHADNVLRAARQPWLAIDPKPLAGEREFGAAAIVRSFELGPGRLAVLRRLDRLAAELGLDRERARGWTIAQTVAWSCDSDDAAQHVETVRWLLEPRRVGSRPALHR